jgi:hypothetical protein
MVQFQSIKDEGRYILVFEKQRNWMKPARDLTCFVNESFVDVLYLNKWPLDFKLDCVIDESEKGKVS